MGGWVTPDIKENQIGDIFQANLIQRNFSRKPVEWESGDYHLGESEEGKYTALRISIPLITPEYPNAVLFFTLSNKQGYAYARTWPDDLDTLADWLKEKAEEARQNSKSLEDKQKLMVNTQNMMAQSQSGQLPDIEKAVTQFNRMMKGEKLSEQEIQELSQIAELIPQDDVPFD